MTAGNCYEASLMALLDYPDWTLCHGYPVLTGGPHEGSRFGHAWLENANGRVVFDAAHDKVIQRALYYSVGKIEEQHVRRYTRSEAVRVAREQDSCGPWTEDPYEVVLYENRPKPEKVTR